MRILPYYLIHTFINAIKKLFRNKIIAVVLAFIAIMGLIGGLIGLAIGLAIPDAPEEPTSVYEEMEENEADYNSADDLTEEDRAQMHTVLEAAVGGLMLLIVLLHIYTGDKSGVKIFTMADVNFLFAAPLRPQSVLMFKTVLQMGLAVISSIYLLFQIPNLMNGLGLTLVQCLCIFIGWVLMLFIGKLAAVFTYTIAATHQALRRYVRPFAVAVALAPALVVAGLVKFGGKGVLDAIGLVFASRPTRYVPLFGWLRGFVMSLVDGQMLSALLYLAALIALCILLTCLIWRIKADFYEDALQGADELREKTEAAQAGKTVRKKERSAKIARNGDLTGEGARVFFTKTMYNRKRFSFLGIFTPTCATYTLIAAAVGLFLRLVVETKLLLPTGVILCIAIFFRNMGNPLAAETSHPFFFLVPESPFRKIRYALTGGIYETALDLIPGFLLTALLLSSSVAELFLWLGVWLSLDLFCSLVGLFIDLALPSSFVPAIASMIGMSIRMTAILPGIFILIAGAVTNLLPALIGLIALNCVVAAILFAFAPRFLHTGKN